jgi:single-strand DNA-binding protein
MAVNKAILVGNLGRDPEVRSSPSGQVCNFTLATSDSTPTAMVSGRSERTGTTSWSMGNRRSCAGNTSRRDARSTLRGGFPRGSTKPRNGGGTRYRTEIIAQRVQFLGGRDGVKNAPAAHLGSGSDLAPPMDDEDISF